MNIELLNKKDIGEMFQSNKGVLRNRSTPRKDMATEVYLDGFTDDVSSRVVMAAAAPGAMGSRPVPPPAAKKKRTAICAIVVRSAGW